MDYKNTECSPVIRVTFYFHLIYYVCLDFSLRYNAIDNRLIGLVKRQEQVFENWLNPTEHT